MSRPKAYEPIQGQRYQILGMYKEHREYEHIDYAKDKKERDYLLKEYRMGGNDFTYKAIELPKKYWNEK